MAPAAKLPGAFIAELPASCQGFPAIPALAGGHKPSPMLSSAPQQTFKATSCAWLKLITKGNLQPSAGLAPRVYLPCEEPPAGRALRPGSALAAGMHCSCLPGCRPMVVEHGASMRASRSTAPLFAPASAVFTPPTSIFFFFPF